METTIRKIGNAVGVLIPHELHAQVGDTYWIVRLMTFWLCRPCEMTYLQTKKIGLAFARVFLRRMTNGIRSTIKTRN